MIRLASWCKSVSCLVIRGELAGVVITGVKVANEKVLRWKLANVSVAGGLAGVDLVEGVLVSGI